MDRWLAGLKGTLFLSTLSLRRATWVLVSMICPPRDFYPRSPCGERLPADGSQRGNEIFLSTLSLRRATRFLASLSAVVTISIHALLAESDCGPQGSGKTLSISIHALLAESDRRGGDFVILII